MTWASPHRAKWGSEGSRGIDRCKKKKKRRKKGRTASDEKRGGRLNAEKVCKENKETKKEVQ